MSYEIHEGWMVSVAWTTWFCETKLNHVLNKPRAGRQGPQRPLASENPAPCPEMGRDEADNPLSTRQCRHQAGAQAHGPSPPPGSTLCSPSQPWPRTSVLHTRALGGLEDRQSQPRPRFFWGPSCSCACPRPGHAGCPSAGTGRSRSC